MYCVLHLKFMNSHLTRLHRHRIEFESTLCLIFPLEDLDFQFAKPIKSSKIIFVHSKIETALSSLKLEQSIFPPTQRITNLLRVPHSKCTKSNNTGNSDARFNPRLANSQYTRAP